MILQKLLIISLFIVVSMNLNSNDYLGISVGAALNLNNASFNSFDNIPNCCTSFSSENNTNFFVSAFYEKDYNKKLKYSIGLLYSSNNSDFTESNIPIGNLLVSNNNTETIVQAKVNHELKTFLSYLSFQPGVSYNFYDNFNFKFNVTFDYLINSSFEQKEVLVSPAGYVFKENQKLIRNVYPEMDIPQSNNFQFALNPGLNYYYKINPNFYLVPEISYNYRFTNITNIDWAFSNVNIGIGVLYELSKSVQKDTKEEIIYQRDTILVESFDKNGVELVNSSEDYEEIETDNLIIERTKISETYNNYKSTDGKIYGEISIFGIEKDGSITKNPQIIIEEIEQNRSFPILNYINFEVQKSEPKNVKFTQNFEYDSLGYEDFDIYKNNLNIIAKRAETNNSKIELVAINPLNKNNRVDEKVIDERLNLIKDYLISSFKINNDNISLSKKDVTVVNNDKDFNDMIEESNTIEILTNDERIFEPINIKQIIREATPPKVGIEIKADAEKGLEKWGLNVSQETNNLRNYQGNKKSDTIIWDILQNPKPSLDENIKFDLIVEDKFRKNLKVDTSIFIDQLTIRKKRERRIQDKTIEKYSLIVFEFNSDKITSLHLKTLNEIKKKITKNSLVYINGHTDRTGDSKYNLELSQRRINNVMKILEDTGAKIITNAYGDTIELFDNDDTEGRKRNRTVDIIIETEN